MKCFNPDCLHQNQNNNNFCQKCGQKLLLKNHFRGIKYLGEGGFGRAFVGIDEHRRNSPCVIKQFLPLQQGSNALQKCIQLFEQEAELLEKLGKYPQIPDLLAFFEQDGKLYLIQEFVEGEDLLKELQRKGRFTEDEVKFFLLEMLPVLDFIHNKNVIHRDIKPENILRRKIPLDPSIYGQISDLVLIDFGVSKQVSASVMTKMGTGVGTIGYTAPEQNRGIAKPASDLYSLAVTAIRLLTGVLPEERNGSMIDDIFDIDDFSWIWKEWLTKNGLSVSNDLANILDKMLADKISDRFQSAREVLDALQKPSLHSKVEQNTTKSLLKTSSTYNFNSNKNTVSIQNLPDEVNEQDIIEVLSEYGKVKNVDLLPSQNQAFVEMSTRKEAELAVSTLDGAEWIGRELIVELTDKIKHQSVNQNTVSIQNLHYEINEEDIIEVLSEYGKVRKVNLLPSQNQAFVEMSTRKEAELAVSTLDGAEWMGRELIVELTV